MAKAGISPAPLMPKPTTTGGGMGGNATDLESLMARIDTLTPGTKEYSELAKQIDAEMKKR